MRQNDRVRQVRRYKMLLCAAVCGAAGALITFIAAKGVLSEHEQTLTTQNEALEKENEDLRTQVRKPEAVEESASQPGSGSEDWAMAEGNEGTSWDTT